MNLQKLADTLRILSADMIEKAQSGHPGASLGMADLVAVLYSKFLKFDASHPDWPNRDRVIFSNGHAAPLLYSILYLIGTPGIQLEDLKNLRQLNSKTPGHPELGITPGIDFSAGPLGQGLAGAVGMAMAERILNASFKNFSHKTYCFVGDGCLMEGISEEAISLAGLWKLNNLIVLWDDNHITIDGETKLSTTTDIPARFTANGWRVLSCDGHNYESIEQALNTAQTSKFPILIDCKTTIGKGAPHKSGKSCVHGSPLGQEELKALRENLHWNLPPFDIPQEILNEGHAIGNKQNQKYQLWMKQIPSEFWDFWNKKFSFSLDDLKKEFLKDQTPMATRQSSQKVLEQLLLQIPQLIGGSADLGASNLTKTKESKDIFFPEYKGNYLNYGVRELAMASIANGLAAHGGIFPYTSTFFVFSDYMKPAMRLGALMYLKQLYIFTHDSIGAGEDGPTHQPIEQLTTLRAMPNITTFRPADAIEVAESYETALNINGPCAIILTRQKVEQVRTTNETNLVQKGAYIIKEANGKRNMTLIATGSEVALALQVANQLEGSAVVSMPSWELFSQQSKQYQQQVLGTVPRVAIEAASSLGWERWVGENGLIIAMDQFGQSAPGKKLFEHFGFTVETILQKIKEWQK